MIRDQLQNAPIHPIGDGLTEPQSTTLPPTGAIGCSGIPGEREPSTMRNQMTMDVIIDTPGRFRVTANGREVTAITFTQVHSPLLNA